MFGEKIQDERIHAKSFLKTALLFLEMNRFFLSTHLAFRRLIISDEKNNQRFAQTNGGKETRLESWQIGCWESWLSSKRQQPWMASFLSALLNFIRIYHGCFAILISPTTAIHQRQRSFPEHMLTVFMFLRALDRVVVGNVIYDFNLCFGFEKTVWNGSHRLETPPLESLGDHKTNRMTRDGQFRRFWGTSRSSSSPVHFLDRNGKRKFFLSDRVSHNA